MASAILVFLYVILLSLCFEISARLLRVECQPAIGDVGSTTKISCSFKMSFEADEKMTIFAVRVTRRGQEDPLFTFDNHAERGNTRFELPSRKDPSLLINDTAVSDEGQYNYIVMTNRGIVPDGTFKISVTAKYSKPNMSSWPEEMVDGRPADLFCNASGGYPAGVIHWFDSTSTNWTESATLEITEAKDRLLKLTSKLTITSINSNWMPFRCVILNTKFIKEGESKLQLKIMDSCHCCSSQKLCTFQFCTD